MVYQDQQQIELSEAKKITKRESEIINPEETATKKFDFKKLIKKSISSKKQKRALIESRAAISIESKEES